MANSKSNFPTATMTRELEENPIFISDCIESLSDLSKLGKPVTSEDLEKRLNLYFSYCADNSCRVGIEGLALACGCDRSTFWRWANGEHSKGARWTELCQRARQTVVAFTESCMLNGKLSPPVAIFAMKNLAGWRDTLSFEDATPHTGAEKNALAVTELPKLTAEGEE